VSREVVFDRDVRFRADYWIDVARILQTNLLICMAFHPETDSLSENSNKPVVCYWSCFATHDETNWDDYLPLVEYTYTSSVHRLTKMTPFELDFVYEPPLQLDLIADLNQPQANESVMTLEGRSLVKQLQRNLGLTRDELCDAQDKQTAEANMSERPIDPAVTAGVNVFVDTNNLPITYANLSPT
jgi:hypothetical protein